MLKIILQEVVATVIGKQYETIADLLDSKKHVNEFIIAKKLDITINQTRNLLYKLSEHGLVSSMRKKDKKKGWYTYFWRIEVLKALEFLKGMMQRKIENIDRQIESRENKTYYYSEITGVEYTEEVALSYNFICPESGKLLVIHDNTKVLKDLERKKEKLKEELKGIDVEIEIEKGKKGKERDKEVKKEEKQKAVKKAEKKAERDAIREKAKKIEKKVPKKQVKNSKKNSKKSAKKTSKIKKKKK
ncbi:MAG: hypothetical protein Q7S56_01850 [Nanoarchaeota archaeon]|nr:hypothetical protein [Nanoarchaeota archaeon]